MNKTSLFSLATLRLGNRTDLASILAAELPFVQEMVLEAAEWKPWFLGRINIDMSLTAGAATLNLPNDFLVEHEDDFMWMETGTAGIYAEVPKVLYRQGAVGAEAGTPQGYAISGGIIYIFPPPDTSSSLKLHYYARDTSLASAETNNWLTYAGDVVMAELCLVVAEKHLRDTALADRLRVDAQGAWSRLYKTHVAQQEANLNRIIGADNDC